MLHEKLSITLIPSGFFSPSQIKLVSFCTKTIIETNLHSKYQTTKEVAHIIFVSPSFSLRLIYRLYQF